MACPRRRCRPTWTRSSAKRSSPRWPRPGSTAPPRPSCSASPSARCATACRDSGYAIPGRMARRSEDWVAGARRVASPNCDSRPAGVEVTLVVLHSISLPRGDYGGDAVERLFTNHLDTAAHPSFADLAGVKVSAHFLIRRDGELIQFV